MKGSHEFYSKCVSLALQHFKINNYTDNIDLERFSSNQKTNDPFGELPERAFWFDWLSQNKSEIYKVFRMLGDESSRRSYIALILFRLCGHTGFKIPLGFTDDDISRFRRIAKPQKSNIPVEGKFGSLKYFDFEFKEKKYKGNFLPLSLEYSLVRGQYFYSSEGVEIQPSEGDTVIDGGACLGDTAVVFSQEVGPHGNVIAFDPLDSHCRIISENARIQDHQNIRVAECGLSDKCASGSPVQSSQYNPGFSVSSSTAVPLTSLDDFLDREDLSRLDFVKLDIEGEEMNAIRGMTESITEYNPKLALSVYHKPNDLFEIPIKVSELSSSYSFYFCHYTHHNEESVIYCINNSL